MLLLVAVLFALSASGMVPDARTLLEQARTALQQNKLSEAKSAALAALQENPKLGDAEVILGLVATAGEDFPSAEKHFKRAISLQPTNPRLHGYLGSTYLAQQRLSEAATEFGAVLKVDPSNVTAHYNLGVIAAISRKPQVAIGHFEAVLQSSPADQAALGALLQTQLTLGRRADARTTAARIQRALPPDAPQILEAGVLLASSGDYTGAIPILESVYRLKPQSTEAGYNLALALFRAGQSGKAISVLETLPDSALGLNLLGTIKETQSDYSAAKDAFARAAKLEARNEDYQLDYAAVLLHDADTSNAITAFQAAAQQFPRSWRVRLGLGSAYYLAGKYEESAAALLQALSIDSGATMAYPLLARAYETAGTHQDAIRRAFRDYLGRKPRDAAAYAAYASMLISDARGDQTADSSEVKAYLEKALELDPKLSDPHLYLGVLAQNEGDLQRAVRHFTKAVSLSPESPQAHYRLAGVLARSGDMERSRAEMRTFQELRARERERDKQLVVRSLTGAWGQ